jgi:hypothetical protein
MSRNTYSLVAGVIFLVIAAAHALRLILKWEVIFAGWQLPLWVSAVAFVLTAYLAYEVFRHSRSS